MHSMLEERKGPHPHTFSFTKKTTRFTKGRLHPYEGPLAALLQEASRSISILQQNRPFVRPFRVLRKGEICLSKTARPFGELKVWAFTSLPNMTRRFHCTMEVPPSPGSLQDLLFSPY